MRICNFDITKNYLYGSNVFSLLMVYKNIAEFTGLISGTVHNVILFKSWTCKIAVCIMTQGNTKIGCAMTMYI